MNNERYYESAIDFTLCTPDLINKISWERLLATIRSDHLPIIFSINDPDYNVTINKRYVINQKIAMHNIEKIIPQHTFDIEEYENELADSIKKATFLTTSRKYNGKTWWNDELTKL